MNSTNKNLRKAVIPAAGLGTRFLPATKTVPKEMLPIVDKPILLHIVEEAVEAGIEDIVIVSGRGKNAIEDFFDCSYELEDHLMKNNKQDIVEDLHRIRNMANIISIRQKQALGLGHAVSCGQPIVGDEAFAVLLGDEVMHAPKEKKTVTGQLADIYNDKQLSTVAVMEVAKEDVFKYGIIDATETGEGLYNVNSVVEKPSVEKAPSQLALPGRYVFTSKIFEIIKNTKPGKNGEIQLTDAMTTVAQTDGMLATLFEAIRYDAGDKLGYLQANIEFALRRANSSKPEDKLLAERLKFYLKELTKNF